jgi:hypothetical protein
MEVVSPATQIEILPLVYIEIVFAKLEKTKYVFADVRETSRRSIVEMYQFLEHKTSSQKSYGRNREPKHSRTLHAKASNKNSGAMIQLIDPSVKLPCFCI